MIDPSQWVKASKSGPNSNCVEQCRPDRRVLVRDTKDDGAGPILAVSQAAYRSWLAAAKGGELDQLLA